MVIRNVHTRVLECDREQAGALLAQVAGACSPLWPVDRWPALLLDRPLGVGARGGHADIRYTCTAYEPGERLEFTFTPQMPLAGTHAFVITRGPRAGTTLLSHELDATGGLQGRLLWFGAIRWLHDALIEDLLDRAKAEVRGERAVPRSWSPLIRVLNAVVRFENPLAQRVLARSLRTSS